MSICVYTAVYGGYDVILPPRTVEQGVDYICFSESDANVPRPWQHRTLELPFSATAADSNRYAKMNPHRVLPGYAQTVYVDGNIEVLGGVIGLMADFVQSGASLGLYLHPVRDCVHAELATCAALGYVSASQVWNLLGRYRKAGIAVDAGLFEAMVLLRSRTPELDSAMEQWWGEWRAGIKRDQVTLPLALAGRGIRIQSLGQSDARFGHRHFRLHAHQRQERPLGIKIRGFLNRRLLPLLEWASRISNGKGSHPRS